MARSSKDFYAWAKKIAEEERIRLRYHRKLLEEEKNFSDMLNKGDSLQATGEEKIKHRTKKEYKMMTKLRKWRQSQGLTLQEVADLVGLHISMISLLERGKRQLRRKKKVMMARRLNTRVADLFEIEKL